MEQWVMEPETRLVIAVLLLLLLFGILYNRWVAGLERTGRDRGYTAFLVVVGVGVTVVGWAVMTWDLTVMALGVLAFAASGTPMIIGSVQRYQAARRRDEEAARAEALERVDDDGHTG